MRREKKFDVEQAQSNLFQPSVLIVKKALKSSEVNINLPYKGYRPIEWAAMKGWGEIVYLFIQKSAEITYTALYLACRENHIEVAKLLLEAGAPVNGGQSKRLIYNYITDESPYIPILVAAKKGLTNIVNLLLQYNCEVNQLEHGFSALTYACQNGHQDIVETLLLFGAKVDLGVNPLFGAAVHGNTQIVALLLEFGAGQEDRSINIWLFGGTSEYPLIAFAAVSGNLDVVKLLHRAGGSLLDIPVNKVIQKGHITVVSYLLENNVPVPVEEINRGELLHKAVLFNDRSLIILLIQSGANISGSEVFHWAITHDDNEIMQRLISIGTPPLSALQFACERNHVRFANMILNCSSFIDEYQSDTIESLWVAYKNQNHELISLFKNILVDITPLLITAIKNNHLMVTSILTEFKFFDIVTVLKAAIENGFVKVIDELLNKKVSQNLSTKLRIDIVMSAIAHKKAELIMRLINKEFIAADSQDNNGVTLLMYCLFCDDRNLLQELVRKELR